MVSGSNDAFRARQPRITHTSVVRTCTTNRPGQYSQASDLGATGGRVAAGRTTKLKFGTSVLVVPGRNPMLLAKELATIDRLSNGRLLPAVGLGALLGATPVHCAS